MRKVVKLIMELIFIFILPLLFILLSIDVKKEDVYNSNNLLESEIKTFEYNNQLLIDTNGYKNIINNFNIFDEIMELGDIDNSTGLNQSSSTRLRSKNYIEVIPNTNYYFYVPNNIAHNIYFYDVSNNFISVNSNDVISFTTPINCYYIRFRMGGGYGTTYKNDICINFYVSWANGNYAPYDEPLILYTQTDVSGQNNINYTPFGSLKKLALDQFYLNDNFIVKVLFDYTVLWFIMFLLWHLLYVLFDGLIHMFSFDRKRE